MKARALIPFPAKGRGLFFVFLAVAALGVKGQVQQAWVARYDNGITNGQHEALKMQIGRDGNIYVCGFSEDANSNLDYAVLKYAPNGNLRWVARYGSSNEAQAKPTGFALDSSNSVVVTGNAGIVKYDSAGNQLWTAPYDGLGVACDSSNNIIVTGYGSSFLTIKLSPAGSNLWKEAYTDVGPTASQAVQADAEGNIYVVGSDTFECAGGLCYAQLLVIKYSSAGVDRWHAMAGGVYQLGYAQVVGLRLGSDTSVYVLANFAEGVGASAGPIPYSTFKFGSDGSVVWQQYNPTGAFAAQATGIAIDGVGDVSITGETSVRGFAGTCYATFLMNPAGSYAWTNRFPTAPTDASGGNAICTDVSGNVYVTGYSPGSNGSNDIVTIAYDSSGKQLWLERYDGPGHGDDEGNAIAVDAQGNVYVAGYDTPVGGGTEMVLIKYAPVTGKHEANGSFQLEVQGAANEPFDVRASTNLADWLDLGTYGADTNGVLLFTDTNAGLFPQRFYVAKPE